MSVDFAAVLDQIDIIQLAQSLGFPRPKAGRTRCILHDGDSPYSFSLNQDKGVWSCFVCHRRGGKLALVMESLRVDKKNAVLWLADFAGVELPKLSTSERKEWAKERERLACRLPKARTWLTAFTLLTIELLDYLKGLPVDHLRIGEIFDTERLLNRLRFLDGPLLLDEFVWWKKYSPKLTHQLITVGAERERWASYALHEFLKSNA